MYDPKYLEQNNKEDFFPKSDKLILEPIEDQDDISFDKNENESMENLHNENEEGNSKPINSENDINKPQTQSAGSNIIKEDSNSRPPSSKSAENE